ncbi:2-oxoglutarate dehydrogenase E1 component [Actinobacillus delphinicola]|uniref:2-oxoglutarate dehydrogenase E1 component n=1 Tax=Actinobacillus delphinicola TaxID=51161 RepID=UPI0024419FB9|nr:2-oxoglutarate dehydrogenase E1 component [Actinobacillus delphinicola]MDG6896521.1 2-oxoglutarate dehydrogenase E1 component [Actinobacillus delphinicola]
MKQETLQEWLASSALAGSNQAYIEDLYEIYLDNPAQVEPSWREIFSRFAKTAYPEQAHSKIREAFKKQAQQSHVLRATSHTEQHATDLMRFIDAYRSQGHRFANTNPLSEIREAEDLHWQHYGFHSQDLSQTFNLPHTVNQQTQMTLQALAEKLHQSYCQTLSAEFDYADRHEQKWLQAQLEQDRPIFTAQQQQQFLQELIAAEGLERYLGAKFTGAKRFSLEGSDAFILLVKEIIRTSAHNNVEEIVFGMAHRGRLNMLVNVFGKKPQALFDEFAGKMQYTGSGDVKYHQGFSSDFVTDNARIHLNLAYNPSHLEIVSPVIQGSVRARQDRIHDTERTKVMAVTVHGDSALAGQGIVQETLNMSKTRGYTVGGTIRIVINNQIGFTTSNPQDTRSMYYCTDVAKMIGAPVLHVNGDDAEAVVRAAHLAVAYRQTFHKDIFIDLVSYRRHGHNEADEPAMTQPLMYQKIKRHPTVAQQYATFLQENGTLSAEQVNAMKEDYRQGLENNATMVSEWAKPSENGKYWSKALLTTKWDNPKDHVTAKQFKALALAVSDYPEDHVLHNRVKKVYADRRLMAEGKKPFDWGMGETMAYATILTEGHNVRLSGEDAGRATFSHRHAALHSQQNAEVYYPLQHLGQPQGHFEVWDSMLSEEGVLAFEYGYASTAPQTLTLWEAQFGDFANGAQMVVDQFISSGEQKWGRMCGLTMLLPHGYEGQGPEHSSARLERYLQLCAEDNMQVCVPTTPAQIYHLLRRQILRNVRRPLIVMTPKSLLRHPLAVSEQKDFLHGGYQTVIGEVDPLIANDITRIIFCTGKVYYDLLEQRRQQGLNHIAIIRIEQLYPYPQKAIADIIKQYPQCHEAIWCQEEPQNQGAWWFIQSQLIATLPNNISLRYAGRPAAAATATGDAALHQMQQRKLVETALNS